MSDLSSILFNINNILWRYIVFAVLIILGLYFTHFSRYFQIRNFPKIFQLFFSSMKSNNNQKGLHPLKTLFTAIGGSIGIGNIIGVCAAIKLGGPGAVFWIWIAGFLGMIVQYCEVYLGMKYRTPTKKGYDGGPMYFLPKAYKNNWIGILVALFIAVYGVEIYLFNVITESISINWQISKILLSTVLLSFLIFVTLGGIKRLSRVIHFFLPIFLISYILMALYLLLNNLSLVPSIFLLIIKSAFSKQAAAGGFAGSTIFLTLSIGLSRGAYAADLGTGYNSVINTETNVEHPNIQAALGTLNVFFKTFILCTLTSFVVLITNAWKSSTASTLMLQEALGSYFPYMQYFMPVFLFLLGFLTVITVFLIGLKCMNFVSKKYGKIIYYIYGTIALFSFSFVNANTAFIFVSIIGAMLLVINLIGIFLLRKDIEFHFNQD